MHLCGAIKKEISTGGDLEQFTTDLGIIRPQGPLTGSTYVCIPFTSCALELLGSFDKGSIQPKVEALWVAENCASLPSEQPGLPNGGRMRLNGAKIVHEGYVTRRVSFEFGDVMKETGKTYSTCWCSRELCHEGDFIEIGKMIIIGMWMYKRID